MTLSIMTFSVRTFSIITISIKGSFVTLSISDSINDVKLCHRLVFFMLNVVMLSVIRLNFVASLIYGFDKKITPKFDSTNDTKQNSALP
jgi:hypothetical protein